MKLLDLYIENYGLYSAKHFDFSDPFVLIYGPNETGKSTLLQLVRELLFGFPHKSPFAFERHTGKLAATAGIQLSDGRRVRFRRQKGTKNTVTGEVESRHESVDEVSLGGMLGNAGPELFQNIFGFSLSELSAGEDSLKHANLSEALYGSGIGGLANFQKVQQSIRDEHTAMFAARARTRPINQLLDATREHAKVLRENAVKPRDYDDLKRQADDHSEQATQLQERLDELQSRLHRAERLERASESWSNLLAARQQLGLLDGDVNLPANVIDDFQRLQAERNGVREQLNHVDENLSDRNAERDSLKLQPGLLAEEARIQSLHQELGRIRGHLKRLPDDRERSESMRSELTARLKEVNADWTLANLDQFQSSMAQRATIQELADRDSDLSKQETSLAMRRSELDRQLTAARKRLDEMEDVRVLPGLEDLVERPREYESQQAAVRERDKKIAQMRSQTVDVSARLCAVVGADSIDFAALQLPLDASLAEHEGRFKLADQTVREATQRLDEAKTELARREAELKRLDSQTKQIGREELDRQRSRRDAAWSLIRRHRLDTDITADDGEGDAVPVPEEYERFVASADRVADERHERAEEVARRDQLSADIKRQAERIAELQEVVAEATAKQTAVQNEWQSLWSHCEFEPLAPSEMREWIASTSELLSLYRDIQDSEIEQAGDRDAVTAFEVELGRAIPGAWESPAASLAEAKSRLERVRESAADRRRITESTPEIEAELETVDADLMQLTMKRAEWQNDWATILDQSGLPSEWTVTLANQILSELVDLRLKHSELTTLAEHITEAESDLSDFGEQVVALSDSVAPDLKALPVADALEQIVERLSSARDAQKTHDSLTLEIKRLEQGAQTRREHERRLSADLKSLQDQTGVATEADLLVLIKQAEQLRQVVDEVTQLERDIRTICGNDDFEQFEADLSRSSSERLASERARLVEDISQLETEHREALQQAAVSRERLEAVEEQSRSIEISAELQSKRATLRTAVDQWAPLVLAETLMTRAIHDFERQHQPRLLQDVARLLERMTHGKLIGLERRLDNDGTLLVQTNRGEAKLPSELSTGAREQLYLAIRLAFVLQYCEDSEPLPLIMDDILVNFDEHRARSTIDVLAEVSQTAQVLFLTCHRHTAEFIAEHHSSTKMIALTSDVPWTHIRRTQSASDEPKPTHPRPELVTPPVPAVDAEVSPPKAKGNSKTPTAPTQPELF